MVEHIEVLHNRQRGHSSIGYLTPIEFEAQTPRGLAVQQRRLRPRGAGQSLRTRQGDSIRPSDAKLSFVRITVTLDDDVAGLVSDAQRREGKSLDQVVNEALGRGLAEGTPSPAAYRVRPHHSAVRPDVDMNALNRLSDEVTSGA